MTKKCLSIFLVLLNFSSLPLWASVGTSGASFLDIPVGAGPASLGGAYSALAADAYSPTYNPGGLGFLESNQIAGQHLSYLESMSYEYASFVHPLRPGRSLGVAVQYFTTGDIPGTDPSGASIGDYSSHYGAYTLAYGQKITDKLALGLASKWIHAKISDSTANTYAFDVGGFYKATETLNAAATVSNIGGPLQFVSQKDPLPLAFHVSGAYQVLRSVLVSAEGVYARDGLASFHTGGQWRPLQLIALRAGYRTDTLKELSPLAGFSTGMALNAWGQEFAYAWLPYDDLGNTHYFSLLIHWGDTAAPGKRNLIQYQSVRTHGPGRASDPSSPDYENMLELLQKNESHLSRQPSLLSGSDSL